LNELDTYKRELKITTKNNNMTELDWGIIEVNWEPIEVDWGIIDTNWLTELIIW
jgi:hypothetical protein